MADQDPQEIERRVRDSFARQAFMATLGASIERVAPGEVDIRLPVRADLTQQHGFMHASAVAAIADSACGYAAFTLMPADAGVLSIEYKVNLMAPATGEALLARARVIRAGRTITVCEANVVALDAQDAQDAQGARTERQVALMVATMMTVRDRPEVRD